MPKPKHTLILNLDDPQAKRDFLRRIAELHGLWEITLKERIRARSNELNRYYWGVVVPCAVRAFNEATGDVWDKNEAHEELKRRFLTKEIRAVSRRTGEIETIRRIGSTAKLDQERMKYYIEEIVRWLGEFFGVEVI